MAHITVEGKNESEKTRSKIMQYLDTEINEKENQLAYTLFFLYWTATNISKIAYKKKTDTRSCFSSKTAKLHDQSVFSIFYARRRRGKGVAAFVDIAYYFFLLTPRRGVPQTQVFGRDGVEGGN